MFGDAQEWNQYGKIAEEELLNVPNHFPNVAIDRYVVMPNHIHVIFALSEVAEHTGRRPGLSSIVGLYKSGVARKIHQNSPNIKVWQKSFYDRILRNEEAYREVCAYIDMNPERWSK